MPFRPGDPNINRRGRPPIHRCVINAAIATKHHDINEHHEMSPDIRIMQHSDKPKHEQLEAFIDLVTPQVLHYLKMRIMHNDWEVIKFIAERLMPRSRSLMHIGFNHAASNTPPAITVNFATPNRPASDHDDSSEQRVTHLASRRTQSG